MARLTENIFEQRQSSFVEAVIVDCPTGDSPDTDHDTACVEVPSMYSIVHGEKIFKDVPIFYHCKANPDRHGRSLEGAATAFRKGDHVILSTNPLAIVGFADGSLRRCRKLYLYLRIRSVYFLQPFKPSFGSEQYLIWDVEEDNFAKLKKPNGSTISFPATREDLEDVDWFDRVEFVGEGTSRNLILYDYYWRWDSVNTGLFCYFDPETQDCITGNAAVIPLTDNTHTDSDSDWSHTESFESFCCKEDENGFCMVPCGVSHEQLIRWSSYTFEVDLDNKLPNLNYPKERIWCSKYSSGYSSDTFSSIGYCDDNRCRGNTSTTYFSEGTSTLTTCYGETFVSSITRVSNFEYSSSTYLMFPIIDFFYNPWAPNAKFEQYAFDSNFFITMFVQDSNGEQTAGPLEYHANGSLLEADDVIRVNEPFDLKALINAELPSIFNSAFKQAIQTSYEDLISYDYPGVELGLGFHNHKFSYEYNCSFCYA